MKSYFERVQQVGISAIAELRRIDAQHTEMHRAYLEDRQKGNLTEQGYLSLVKVLDDTRTHKESEFTAQLDKIQQEYQAAVDDYCMPSASKMDSADIELLRNFEISASEFDKLAKKHRDNPTMGRFLESYRKEHGVPTNWRYQTPEERKEIFNSMRFGIDSVIRTLDKYHSDREGAVSRLTANAYHKLQGSDPDALPTPTGGSDAVGSGRNKPAGFSLF